MDHVDSSAWGQRNWTPPNAPIHSDPDFPEIFDWTSIDGLVISPPKGEDDMGWRARNDRNLDIYIAAVDEYSTRLETFINERKAAVKEQKKLEAKRKREVCKGLGILQEDFAENENVQDAKARKTASTHSAASQAPKSAEPAKASTVPAPIKVHSHSMTSILWLTLCRRQMLSVPPQVQPIVQLSPAFPPTRKVKLEYRLRNIRRGTTIVTRCVCFTPL